MKKRKPRFPLIGYPHAEPVKYLPPPARGSAPVEPIVFHAEDRPSDSQRRRWALERLWNAQEKLCYWCKRPTILWLHQQGKRIPGNAFTRDHLYSRLDPRRNRLNNKIVGACSTCNGMRSRMQCQDMSANGKIAEHLYNPAERIVPKVRP